MARSLFHPNRGLLPRILALINVSDPAIAQDPEAPAGPERIQDALQSLSVVQRRPLPSQPLRRLLVRATNWVGDAVLILPAICRLRELFPQAHLAVLAVPRVAPVFQGHPAISEIILSPSSAPAPDNPGRWPLLKKLRARRFELALLFPNSFESALVAWAAGIPHRLGYNTDYRTPLLTTIIRSPEKLAHLHQVYRHLGLLRAFGNQVPTALPALYLDDQDLAQARDLMAQKCLEPAQLIIGISPGAAYGSAKQWLPERFAAVAEQLQKEFDARIVLLGGPGDAEVAGRIVERMRHPAVNLVGQTDLRTAMAVIKHLALLITNDSGLMHVAAALRVPLVALFGSTDSDSTGPFTPLATVLRHPVPCSPCLERECPTDHRCMELITAAEVVAAARDWLARTA
ncbi:MAG: lipopolysaccharide heptosyltransferase II [Deltaproteobacteria bacterium]|nr:lipopolysaccharide heptosyltransferase II [Deltaproteobacteria bacterium]